MSDYGTTAGVAAYTKRLTNALAEFDDDTNPTLTEVETFLDQVSDTMNGWLARAGYVIPVTAARAVDALAKYANLGAAGHVELSQRAGGYDAEDENRRENKFFDLFKGAEAYINSGALAQLGAATVTDSVPPPLSGFRIGGRTRSGQAVRPAFSRRSFGWDPVAETPTTKEATYTED